MNVVLESGSRQRSPGRLWVAVGVYIVVTLSASAGLLVVQSLTGLDAAVLSLVQFGPAIAAALTWMAFRKNISGLLPPEIPWRRVLVDLVAVITVCVAIWALASAAMAWSGHHLVGPAAIGSTPFAVFLALQLVGACGEEIGWRGLMQPMLETRMRRLAAVLVTGAVWACWHVQVFAAGAVPALSFVVAALSFAVVLGYLGNGSVRQRILVATVGHWLINVGWYLVAGDDTLSQPQVIVMAVTGALAAGAVLAVTRARRRA
ncbi:CPBP family intramembrane glutamic endopeptidase [Nocardia inohanensis]|uniref:CPBP family intramembrane glutamic endopeptidase n=1 Tax=Nocardia inohanensis TaxID=209246 RepID=UPI0008339B14|nr:type II CAAX endopeptidase family protein [Nocardia inohanensis]